jgi:hypothetical protein
MSEQHSWTGVPPHIHEETLSDGSKVFNVIIPENTVFCVDEKHATQLITDLNEVAKKAV